MTTWKAIILIIFGLGLIAYATEHPWIFGVSVTGFVVLIWVGYKLDRMTGIR